MLQLNIDEHTGEAGFITRIEAFADMLFRKKRQNLIYNNPVKEIVKKSETEKVLEVSSGRK